MASNTSKWSQKRSIHEIEGDLGDVRDADVRASPSLDSRKDWKVKTLDEILAEKEKRRKLDLDSPDEESSRQSLISSTISSPGLLIDSKASSKNQSPTQEIIYQLSPDHYSPLSSSSDTSKRKSRLLQQKGRRKTDEEEGEILSDISDGEPRKKSRSSSRHVSIDVEMEDEPTEDVEPATKEAEESKEESSEESESSSEEEPNKQTEITEEQESSEEESSEASEESDDSSDVEEVEKEEKSKTEEKGKMEEKSKMEEKVKETEESSEDESEDDSDSEDSEDSDSSEEEEEEEEETEDNSATIAQSKTTSKVDEVDSSPKKLENISSANPSDIAERQKERDRHSKEVSSRHRRTERPREEDRPSHREREDKNANSREKQDRKTLKENTERTSRKHKSTSESSDHKKSREIKRQEKDRVERSRERSDRPDKDDFKRKTKDSKSSSSKEQTKSSSKDKDSRSTPKIDEKSNETRSKDSLSSKLLTDEERLQFSTVVVDYDSDDQLSDDHDTDGDDLDVSESIEKEEEEISKPELPNYLPAIQGCRNVSEEFVWLNRIEEGTYGVVYRARDKRTNEIVALKRLKMEKEKEGFPITSLREINTLLKGQHPNIVTVREVVVGGNMDKIFIVMDYVEHDLKTLMEHMSSKFAIGEVKTLLVQLLRAVAHLHDNWILHRDLKTSNLLLSNKGILKVADFGLAREYGSPLKPYTPIVVTLWYRAPELLLGIKEYACPIDMWSVGCIFAELLTMKPLFPGKSEIDQINKIFKDLGTPSDKIWTGPPSYSELPHVKKMNFTEYPYNQLRNKFGTYLTDKGFDLLNKFLTYDPKRRITAEEALKHDYFNESPYPVKPDMFPTWPAKSEMMKRPKKRDYEHSPKPPEGGEMFSKLKEGGDSSGGGSGSGAGFHMLSSKKGSAAVAGFSLKF